MRSLSVRPWAHCAFSTHIPRSKERGGIWIWIFFLVLAASAVGGGVFYRDYALVQQGQTDLAEAKRFLDQRAYDKAEEGYQKALESWTAIGSWTPLNKEAVVAERAALRGLLSSRIHNVSTEDPLLAERLLGQLKTLDEKASEAELEELIRERFSVSLLLSLERKGYKKLDQVWKQILDGKENSSAKLKQLSKEGSERAKARVYVQNLLTLLSQKSWSRVESHLNGGNALEQSSKVFRAFDKEFKGLQGKMSRAKQIYEAWNKLNKCVETFNSWCAKLENEPAFLGGLHKKLPVVDSDFPKIPPGSQEGFEQLIKEFNETRASCSRLFEQFRVLANDYKNMSLIDSRRSQNNNRELVFMDRYEVTREQYKTLFMEKGGYSKAMRDKWDEKGWDSIIETRLAKEPDGWGQGGSMQNPVSGVSFWEARAYAKTVAKKIPMKAQWLAALPVEGYPWGEEWDDSAANLSKSQDQMGSLVEVTNLKSGQSKAGITHLFGNVREWSYEVSAGSDDLKCWLMGGSFETEAKRVKEKDETVLFEEAGTSDQESNIGIRLIRTLIWDPIKKVAKH
jgi:hypothetical protein